jgi:uncharacterized membrane protein
MRLDPWVGLTIITMAIAAYGCRGGGYWLFSKIKPSPALRTILSYVPGSLFVSYVIPGVLNGGPKEWIGGAVAIVTVLLTRSMIWPVFTGTAAAWIVWLLP